MGGTSQRPMTTETHNCIVKVSQIKVGLQLLYLFCKTYCDLTHNHGDFQINPNANGTQRIARTNEIVCTLKWWADEYQKWFRI